MADRYYICAMVGNGDDPDTTPQPWAVNTGPFRASLSDLPQRNAQGEIIHTFDYVLEVGKYAVVNVNSLDFTLVDSFAGPLGDYPLPDSLLDVPLDTDMSQAHKTFFGNLLKKWLNMSNADANNVVNQTTTYREAFDYMASQLTDGKPIDKIRARAIP